MSNKIEFGQDKLEALIQLQNKLNRKEAREGISRLEMDIKYIKCSLTGIVLILVSIIGLVLGK